MSDEERVENMTSELDLALQEDESREIAQPRNAGAQSDALIRLAIDRNADMDKLERLIDLRDREEAKEAKRRYHEAFAAMQGEFEPVYRSKQGDKSKYAPLEALQKQYNSVIHQHGFSYRWDEESLPGGELRVIMTISGHGHSESNHKDLPAYEPDKGSSSGKPIMNVLQAEGSRASYGRRYTFVAGFGVTVSDEDDDGEAFGFRDGLKYADYINSIEATTTLEDAHETGRQYYKELEATDDRAGLKIITSVVTNHKTYLKTKAAKNAKR